MASENEDLPHAVIPDISNFPVFLLQEVLSYLLPRPLRVDAPRKQWLPIVRLLSAQCRSAFAPFDAVGESLRESISRLDPSIAGECTSWTRLLALLRGISKGAWHLMQPLRAHRGGNKFSTPLQKAPHISGASLCFVGGSRIVLFGGRCSVSGDTVDATYVVRIPVMASGVVQWEELHCSKCSNALQQKGPAARCYHAAIQGFRDSTMFVFGGAGGDLVSRSDSLLGDTWMLEVLSVTNNQLGQWGAMASCGLWERCHGSDTSETPSARSSHVFAAWSSQRCAVLHGGLGEGGVVSDTWLLQSNAEWHELRTSGPRISRAHHCGGVVGDALLIYSGQDERYLTVSGLFMLQLLTGVWEEVPLLNGPSPRIDAAAAVIDSVGLLVFGGVGCDFEFEPPSPWMLPAVCTGTDSSPRMMTHDTYEIPCARACSSMCSDGLYVYIFGGFDGEQDLGDLWCLDLVPNCFGSSSPAQHGLFLLPQVASAKADGPKFHPNSWHSRALIPAPSPQNQEEDAGESFLDFH